MHHLLHIGGDWVDAAAHFDTVDPATGKVLAGCAEAGPDEVDAAVRAARAAFADPLWARLTAADRARLLWAIADLIEKYADELARLETLDQGQPIGFARGFSVAGAAEHFRYLAGWCTKIEGSTVSVSRPDTLLADRANDTEYGLAAAIWTRDLATAHRTAAAIRGGSVFVNMPPIPDAAASWGGFKASGIDREMGASAIDAYTETKGVWIRLA